MNIPSIPTDNLYKFIAIFGLILVILGLLYPTFLNFEFNIERAELVKDIDNVKLKNELQIEYIKFLKSLSANPENKELREKFLDLSVIENQKNEALIEELNLITKRNSILTEKAKQFEFVYIIGNIIAIIGVFLMGFGFKKWYSKLQKYQDIIVQKEALKYKRTARRRRTYFTIS